MIRFLVGYALGRHREAWLGCAGLLLLAVIVVASIYYTIVL